MRISHFLVVTLLACSAVRSLAAQESHDEIPQAVEVLRQSATSKTEFTLNHSMLILASKLDSENEDLVRVIAGLTGVSVHRYRFSGPWA